MQWLIDIIQEWIVAQGYALKTWVKAQGYLTTAFWDRGDPAAYDFAMGDFTRDSAWHDLDLSGIVPENAKAVLFVCHARANDIDLVFVFREKGNVNEMNTSRNWTKVAGVYMGGDYVCPLDETRKLHYLFEAGNWTAVYFSVKGWWL